MALSVEQVEKLRAAGFSDEDIRQYEAEQATAPVQTAPADPNAPAVNEYGEAVISETVPAPTPGAAPVTEPSTSWYETALGLGPGALDLAKDLLTLGAGGVGIYGAARLPGIANRGFEAWKEASRAKMATADVEKMAEQGRQARFNAKIENDMLKADEMRMKNDELRAKNDAIRQSRAAPSERPVVFRQQPGVVPGPGGQVPVQGPPSANNYMQRMNNLAEQYRSVNPVINPPAQPAPVQQAQPQQVPTYRGSSGMTYKPIQGGGGMRGGGGGGGGGGGLMQDPLNRRFRPLQF